ncbi:nucleotidyltransferase domain-containing protein [Mesobacillus foraminis]|uniref:nucleotidyltransferase domain-containing protein n=1 Tax=Mesobacillus foraminis TaxID=279826 RepID=UPI001BE9F1C7|nr:nucleotidyltransferase domain-containing protein [Mesobacillus foraminis]MBT2756850.1 nucleotidyltransferase domain-containing protein [Mesobacillus foraminis]
MNHDTVIQQIVSLLKSCQGVNEAYLFGSRSNGTAGERSDYDIAIKTNDISDKEFNLLALKVQEDINTLHKIDVIHLNTLKNPVLLENIISKGTLILKKFA